MSGIIEVGDKPMLHRWTRTRYEEMVAVDLFGPEDKVELLNGQIVEMSPQDTRHAVTVRLVERALNQAFPSGYDVRGQLPFALDDASEPEPDVAVVPGEPRDYLDSHPSKAALLVEVAESSLNYDRSEKLKAYARNGIPDYWIVNLTDRQVEVHRKPNIEDENSDSFFGIQEYYQAGETITPLAEPECEVAVDDLLP